MNGAKGNMYKLINLESRNRFQSDSESRMSRPWPTDSGALDLPKVARHFFTKTQKTLFFWIVGSSVIFAGNSVKAWRLETWSNPWQIVFHNAKGVAFVNVGVQLSKL